MTDLELKQKYEAKYEDLDVLRETIKRLDRLENRSEADSVLLAELTDYRTRFHANDKLAWYTITEMATVFD